MKSTRMALRVAGVLLNLGPLTVLVSHLGSFGWTVRNLLGPYPLLLVLLVPAFNAALFTYACPQGSGWERALGICHNLVMLIFLVGGGITIAVLGPPGSPVVGAEVFRSLVLLVFSTPTVSAILMLLPSLWDAKATV